MKFRQLQFTFAIALLPLPAVAIGQTVAQQPAAAPSMLRSESRVVRVDAVVTDKKGNYVADLTAKDFQVFDNGKEQPIVNFSFGSSSGSSANGDRHYMVLFFDDATMDFSDQPRARQAALKFIDANAGPDRLIAVVDFTGSLRIVQNFTADPDRLKKAAALYKGSAVSPNATDTSAVGTPPESAGPSIFQAQNDFSVYTFLLAVRSLARDLAPVPGRKSLILFTDGFQMTAEQQVELAATISECNRANVAVYPLDVRGLIAPPPVGRLLPERKMDRRTPFGSSQQASLETRAHPHLVLAAYPVPAALPAQHGGGGGGGHGGGGGGGGIGGGGGGGGGGGHGGSGPGGGAGGGSGPGGSHGGTAGGSGGGGGVTNPSLSGALPYGSVPPQAIVPQIPDGGAANQGVLYELAIGTGGFPIYNTNDLLGGLARIAHEQDEYYLLAYAAPDSPDGECHTLKVKVDRGGTNVRSRTGYCNAKPQDLLLGKPVEKDLEARAAAAEPGNVGGTLEAPFVYTSPNQARVNVAMQFPASSVEFSKEKGKYHADINVLGIAYRPDGSVGARFSDQVTLELEKDALKNFNANPMKYRNQFEIAPGTYRLAVVLSAGGKNFGKYETPLAIDPFDGKMFTLSAIALSDDIEPAEGLDSALEADLLSDRAPLIVRNMQVVPSGSNHFKRTENVALYAQVYNPNLAGPNPPAVKLSFRIVDLKTGEPVLAGHDIDTSPFVNKGSPVLPIGLKLPVNQLSPGTYRLDLQASDNVGARTVIRAVQFDAE